MTVCKPPERAVVLKTATPAAFRVTVWRTFVPSRNSTWPVGVPLPGAFALTTAVNVASPP